MKLPLFFFASFLFATYCSAQTPDDIKHIVVYQEDGKFGGWPANNGAWIFDGDQLLVGFTRGEYELKENGHNIGKGFQECWLARSVDGGETWKAYNPGNYVGDRGAKPKCLPLKKPINFQHPKFALRMVGAGYHGAKDGKGHFYYTYDGGNTWSGPHRFGQLHQAPELKDSGLTELTPRTDYVVTGKHEAVLLLSSRKRGQFGTDRIFAARTKDGGKSFEFLTWVVPVKDNARAVMPETFRTAEGTFITAMRRKTKDEDVGEVNWVDAYTSTDGGQSWKFTAKIGDSGTSNGNPPAIAATADGRLCAVFGERDQGRILAAYSSDQGKTWSKPIVLRDEFGSEDNETNDLGYPRLLRRSDGKMVAVYYYSTTECLHHIAATIWTP